MSLTALASIIFKPLLWKTGFVYWSVPTYRAFMRFQYGKEQDVLMHSILAEIQAGDRVLDLCAGDAAIAPQVEAKGASYLGLELQDHFVAWAKLHKLPVEQRDIATSELPKADIVMIQSSLYHFLPNERPLVDRMLASAEKKVIISEPVQNVAKSALPFLRWIALLATRVASRSFSDRFSLERLQGLMTSLAETRNLQLKRKIFRKQAIFTLTKN